MKFFIALCLLALCASPIKAITFGTSTAVTANTATDISFSQLGGLLPTTLTITTDQDAEVTLNLVTVLPRDLPSGIVTLGFGLSLTVTPASAVIVDASITTPALTVTGTNSLSILMFDAASNFYATVPSTVSQGKATFALPEAARGTYIAAQVSTGTFLPDLFNKVINLVADVRSKIQFPSGFSLSVQANADADLTVTHSATNPTGSNAGVETMASLDAYFVIDLSGAEQAVDATLLFAYDKSVATAKMIKEETIRLAFFNTTVQAWQFVSAGSVDTSASVVSQTTTHFSTWAAYGEASTSDNGAVSMVASVALVAISFVALLF
jgi:hypothetical protein